MHCFEQIQKLKQRCNEDAQWVWMLEGHALDPVVPPEHAANPQICISKLQALGFRGIRTLVHCNSDTHTHVGFDCYRPQTNFAKVMFLHVSVCPQWGGPGPHIGGRLRGLPGGVSRPTPMGEVEGSGWGLCRPTPRGVSRPTPGGVSRPTLGGVSRPTPGWSPDPHPGGCIPACTKADPQQMATAVGCYVMLWPALTWRGQEWAQHVQGQLLHTCIMQAAGSSHVMELLTDSI